MRIVFERIRIHFYVCVSLLPLLLRRLDDTRGLLYSCKFFPIEIEHLYQFPKQIISSDAAAVACTGKQLSWVESLMVCRGCAGAWFPFSMCFVCVCVHEFGGGVKALTKVKRNFRGITITETNDNKKGTIDLVGRLGCHCSRLQLLLFDCFLHIMPQTTSTSLWKQPLPRLYTPTCYSHWVRGWLCSMDSSFQLKIVGQTDPHKVESFLYHDEVDIRMPKGSLLCLPTNPYNCD